MGCGASKKICIITVEPITYFELLFNNARDLDSEEIDELINGDDFVDIPKIFQGASFYAKRLSHYNFFVIKE